MRGLRRLQSQPAALAGLLALGLLAGCANPAAPPENAGPEVSEPSEQTSVGALGVKPPAPSPPGQSFTGLASWYGKRFHGRLTASGSRYDMTALTAAHRSLAFGTRLRVTHLANQRSVVVVVNDRGPFIKGRVIDLSRAAAEKLGFIEVGLARVRVDVLAQAKP